MNLIPFWDAWFPPPQSTPPPTTTYIHTDNTTRIDMGSILNNYNQVYTTGNNVNLSGISGATLYNNYWGNQQWSTTTGGTISGTITFQPATPLQFVTVNIPNIGYGTANTFWTGALLETDPDLFKAYVKRMEGKVLVCHDKVDEYEFIVERQYALTYIYMGLAGKFKGTDVASLDEMEINDDTYHLRFEDPKAIPVRQGETIPEKNMLIYDELELNAFYNERKASRTANLNP
jgi:hypothetical protein